MNYGDKCHVTIIVQNLTEKKIKVRLGVRAINADFGDDHSPFYGLSGNVATEGRKLFVIPLNSKAPGEAILQVKFKYHGRYH